MIPRPFVLPASCAAALVSLVLSGCGSSQGQCATFVAQSILLEIEEESGARVVPDDLVVTHDSSGNQTRPTLSCSTIQGGIEEGAGSFTIRAECGSETITRQVEIERGECHVQTKTVSLIFPDGACQTCPIDDSTPDAGTGDTSDAGSTADMS